MAATPEGSASVEVRCAVVGAGRVGRALVRTLPGADGPFGHGFDGGDHEVVILAVPDREIARAAAAIEPRASRLVGHCSGATTLVPLAPHESFGVHPLMTVSGVDAVGRGSPFTGAFAAVAGSSPRALAMAEAIALELGMRPFTVRDEDRATYHAAASVASNFLVTIEDAAEQLLGTLGLDRDVLLPLVRATVENWGGQGRSALTGPVARGDRETVVRQRAAIIQHAPQLVALFDALVLATEAVAIGSG